MKIQPGLHGVIYGLSHEEWKQLAFVVRELAEFMEECNYSHLGRSLLNRIAEILEIKLGEKE